MIFALLVAYDGQLTGTCRQDRNGTQYIVVLAETRNYFVVFAFD
jgi:hypothetical protein